MATCNGLFVRGHVGHLRSVPAKRRVGMKVLARRIDEVANGVANKERRTQKSWASLAFRRGRKAINAVQKENWGDKRQNCLTAAASRYRIL